MGGGEMRPFALVVFAVLARLLWIWPAWVAVLAGGALAIVFVVEYVRSELRRRRWDAEGPSPPFASTTTPQCTSRSTIGTVYHRCSHQEGHEGPHQDDLYTYWDRSA
jgi:hypothetical protein